jgi:peptide deformylase
MKRPLAYYGDAVLRQKAQPVESITPEIEEIVRDMIETMDGIPDVVSVGIAAPQVHISLRIFIVRPVDEDENGKLIFHPPLICINPTISNPSTETEELSEGCLSIPGLSAPVRRPLSITLKATGLDGVEFERRFTGYEARIVMHENDHLNGVLFIDRLSPAEKQRLDAPLRVMKQNRPGGST